MPLSATSPALCLFDGVGRSHGGVRTCGFLLTTVYLWCLLNGKFVRACAPTGIAAANIELEGTKVSASTLHCLFDFDGSFESRLDFSKTTNEKVGALIALEVLLLDEVLWGTVAVAVTGEPPCRYQVLVRVGVDARHRGLGGSHQDLGLSFTRQAPGIPCR